jgi:hypothetical protein
MLATTEGTLCLTSQTRSGYTVITRVTTRNTGPTMLETDFSPTPAITRPATTSTPNRGGGAVVSAAG